MAILPEYGNSINVTQRTLYAQTPIGAQDTAFRRIYNELRQRWPQADVMQIIDAASEMAWEEINAPGDDPDEELVWEALMDRRLAQTQEAIDEAQMVLDALGYTDDELDELYEECRERDEAQANLGGGWI